MMGAQSSAIQVDERRTQMESPIEVVRRFCAAWSDNIGAAELAAFFTDDGGLAKIREAAADVLIAAHSLGTLLVTHWLAESLRTQVE